jgi:hypothetical protein
MKLEAQRLPQNIAKFQNMEPRDYSITLLADAVLKLLNKLEFHM